MLLCMFYVTTNRSYSKFNVRYITHRIVSGKLPDMGTADFGQSFIRAVLPPVIFWSWLFRPTSLVLVKCNSWTRDEKISCLVTSLFPCEKIETLNRWKQIKGEAKWFYLLLLFSSLAFTSASTTKCAHIFVSRDSITPFNMFKPKPRIISTISRKKPCSLQSIWAKEYT